MAALRFDHLALPVADAAAARWLFGEVLGLELLAAHEGDDWDGAPWLMMVYGLAGGGQLALCARAGGAGAVAVASDLPHYAFAAPTRTALDTWQRKLEQAGLGVRSEDHGGQRSLYFEDPGGTTWEITAPPSRATREAGAAARIDAWLAAHGRA